MALSQCWCHLWVTVPLLLLQWSGLLVAAEQVALVEVFLEQRPGASAVLQGEVVESGGGSRSPEDREELQGELVLVSRIEENQNVSMCAFPCCFYY